MTSDQLRAEHPRRAGVADALERMIPVAGRDERRFIHRIELRERLK